MENRTSSKPLSDNGKKCLRSKLGYYEISRVPKARKSCRTIFEIYSEQDFSVDFGSSTSVLRLWVWPRLREFLILSNTLRLWCTLDRVFCILVICNHIRGSQRMIAQRDPNSELMLLQFCNPMIFAHLVDVSHTFTYIYGAFVIFTHPKPYLCNVHSTVYEVQRL